MDCNLPGSSVHGVFQARVLEWAASEATLKILDHVFLEAINTFYSSVFSDSRMVADTWLKICQTNQYTCHNTRLGLKVGTPHYPPPGTLLPQIDFHQPRSHLPGREEEGESVSNLHLNLRSFISWIQLWGKRIDSLPNERIHR